MIILCQEIHSYSPNPKITPIFLVPERTTISVLFITLDSNKPITFLFNSTNISLHLHVNYTWELVKIIGIKKIDHNNSDLMRKT